MDRQAELGIARAAGTAALRICAFLEIGHMSDAFSRATPVPGGLNFSANRSELSETVASRRALLQKKIDQGMRTTEGLPCAAIRST